MIDPLTVHSCRSYSMATLRILGMAPCAIPIPYAPHVAPIPLPVPVVHCQSAPICSDYYENFQRNFQLELNSPCCCRQLYDWRSIRCVYYNYVSARLRLPQFRLQLRQHRAFLALYSIGHVSLAGNSARWRHC